MLVCVRGGWGYGVRQCPRWYSGGIRGGWTVPVRFIGGQGTFIYGQVHQFGDRHMVSQVAHACTATQHKCVASPNRTQGTEAWTCKRTHTTGWGGCPFIRCGGLTPLVPEVPFAPSAPQQLQVAHTQYTVCTDHAAQSKLFKTRKEKYKRWKLRERPQISAKLFSCFHQPGDMALP